MFAYNFMQWVGETDEEYSGHSRVFGDDHHHGGIVCVAGTCLNVVVCLIKLLAFFLCLADAIFMYVC